MRHGRSTGRSRRGLIAAAVLGAMLVAASIAQALHLVPDTEDHTTLEQVLVGDGAPFERLSVDDIPDETHVVRDGAAEGTSAIPDADPNRADVRDSLAYFNQMTDFQLADEESPARVEFADPGANSAWRPQEAFVPFQIDATIRQINALSDQSPVPEGGGTRRAMDFSLLTGDNADNMHRNESVWVRELIEGGNPVNFNSGGPITDPTLPGCAAASITPGSAAIAAEAPKYTGVQDYDDYPLGAPNQSLYYDPDDPQGQYADWPEWTGLMDRAQQLTITPAGLDTPSYVTNGNHDVLVQGNEDANQFFERVAIGCEKVLASTITPVPCTNPDPDCMPPLQELLQNPSAVMPVPPDPQRQFTSKPQIKQIYGQNDVDNDHGFGFVNGTQNAVSNGSASYYAWDPPETPGFRFISIDTNSEGGVVEQSSSGNIDDPQFQWLDDELEAAQADDKLVVIFGHHPVRSLTTEVPDEAASPCTVPDSHGHDVNPGCDLDPRLSEPLHLGDTTSGGGGQSFVDLLDQYPNVLAYVAGHTHEHRLLPFERSDGQSAWWEINTSAVVDWPTQSRLIEVMDNRDGTLSIFGTAIDHASTATAPAADPEGDEVSTFGNDELASIGRTLTFNDPQNNFSGEGRGPLDRNAEMLLFDPRSETTEVQGPPDSAGATGSQPGAGGPTCKGPRRPGDGHGNRPVGYRRAATIAGTSAGEKIVGTSGPDVIAAGAGGDTVRGLGAKDLICGQKGKDRLFGGPGRDVLYGGPGRDRTGGGKGRDACKSAAHRSSC